MYLFKDLCSIFNIEIADVKESTITKTKNNVRLQNVAMD